MLVKHRIPVLGIALSIVPVNDPNGLTHQRSRAAIVVQTSSFWSGPI